MSRADELRMVDPVLTSIAQSYTNNSFIWNRLFPITQVSKLKGKIPVFGKENFLLHDTNRAMGADSNRLPSLGFELQEFTTQEQDAEMAVDYLEEEESSEYLRYEQRITKSLSDILNLQKEKEAADIVQNPANYVGSLKTVITATEAFNDYELDIDPLAIIREGMEAVRSRIAQFPNTMIIGEASYKALINHPKVLEKIQYSGLAKANKKILEQLLDIENVYIGLSVYSADGTSFSDIWADNIVLAYVDNSDTSRRSEYNLSYGYTFQREGKPEVDSYYENGGKIKVIRNTDNYCIKVTASDAAFLIYNTNH